MLKCIADAIQEWDAPLELEDSSRLRYRRILRRLEEFCAARSIQTMNDLSLEELDRFRRSRKLARTTSARELQVLRQCFSFCVERKWARENWAKKIKAPPNPKPREVVPYTSEQVALLLVACDRLGQTAYERQRARGITLLMRHTGLRIGDVVTLARDRVRDGKIALYTQKTASFIFLPLPADVLSALAALPLPRRADGIPIESGYYFWSGATSKRALVNDAGRTFRAVARIAEIPNAHPHRFRHTLATEILAKGGTLQDVADILGISIKVAEKHYAKWSPARQERIFALMRVVQIPAGEETARGLIQ